VVDFLDKMMRGREESLRVEEVVVPKTFIGKPLAALNLKQYPRTLLLAVKRGEDWSYNPSRSEFIIEADDKIVVMTTPEERRNLESGLDKGS
jgi:Trk K+ transport system NAD-binding subunit